MRLALLVVSALLIIATLLPFVPTSERWIRILDFPRLQIALLIVVAGVAYLLFGWRRRLGDVAVLAALAAALGWQLFHIFPYTGLAPVRVTEAKPDAQPCLSLVVANVLMENRRSEDLLGILRRADPDVVLLLEADSWWDEAMQPLVADYPHAVRQPQDNYYGMLFYSRLDLIDPGVEFLVDENVPSVHTRLVLPEGRRVAFYGLHPPPPPLADTSLRDAEVLLAGRLAKEADAPAIIAGDLNDVGWSPTTTMFREISGLLDPRHGRGFFATYSATNPLLRWPLDHVVHDERFALADLRLLEPFGSDHFPLYARLCLSAAAEAVQEEPEADPDEEAEASEKIREGQAEEPEPGEYPKPK